jgi:hypothetical protein
VSTTLPPPAFSVLPPLPPLAAAALAADAQARRTHHVRPPPTAYRMRITIGHVHRDDVVRLS